MHTETVKTEEKPEDGDNRHDRRTFLGYAIGALGALITAVVGIPVVGALVLPALRQAEAGWVSAGPIAGFPVGQPKAATVTISRRDGWIEQQEEKGIWVVRRGDNDFTVYNGRCVHLGCAYSWQPNLNQFICPCHGGLYSLDGTVLGGPPPRPLDTMQWKAEQGNLLVLYEDFRLGVPQKEAA